MLLFACFLFSYIVVAVSPFDGGSELNSERKQPEYIDGQNGVRELRANDNFTPSYQIPAGKEIRRIHF